MAIKKKTVGTMVPTSAKSARSGCQVNLSTEEKALIDRAAAFAGLERSAFMRSESIKAARQLVTGAGSAT